MKDLFRNLLSIRQQRRPPPVGPAPAVGAEVINGDVKMLITHAISRDLWNWLALSGWRNVPVKNDRRQGKSLPPSACEMLVRASASERDVVHMRLMEQVQRGG